MRLLRLFLTILSLAGFVLFFFAGPVLASTPSDPLASPTHWSVALVAGFVATQIIPVIAALATKRPNHWTGIITLALSFVDMLATNIAEAGDGVDWKQVIITTGLAFAAARLIAYKGIIERTPLGDLLWRNGNKGAPDTGSG